jgi:hypothetical protein
MVGPMHQRMASDRVLMESQSVDVGANEDHEVNFTL